MERWRADGERKMAPGEATAQVQVHRLPPAGGGAANCYALLLSRNVQGPQIILEGWKYPGPIILGMWLLKAKL